MYWQKLNRYYYVLALWETVIQRVSVSQGPCSAVLYMAATTHFKSSRFFVSLFTLNRLIDSLNHSPNAMPPEAISRSSCLISCRQYFPYSDCGSFCTGSDIISLQVCHTPCVWIISNNKDRVPQYITLYYSKSNSFRLRLYKTAIIRPFVSEVWKENFFTFLKRMACWWLSLTTETFRYFGFALIMSCVFADSIIIVATLSLLNAG